MRPDETRCAACGSSSKAIGVRHADAFALSDAVSLVKTREFYERHRGWAAIALAATLAASVLGLYVDALLGAILGALLGAVVSLVTPLAVMKHRETERTN